MRLNTETGETVTHVLKDKDVGRHRGSPGLLAVVEGPNGSAIAGGAHASPAIDGLMPFMVDLLMSAICGR